MKCSHCLEEESIFTRRMTTISRTASRIVSFLTEWKRSGLDRKSVPFRIKANAKLLGVQHVCRSRLAIWSRLIDLPALSSMLTLGDG